MVNLGPFSYSTLFIMDLPMGSPYGKNQLGWNRVVPVDIDGDGDLEIVVSGAMKDSNDRTTPEPLMVFDYRGGKMVNISQEVIPAGVENVILRNFVVADFNGDGIDDIFLNNTGSEITWPLTGEQNRLLLSNGSGGYDDATSALPQITDFSHGSVAADFDGDGDIDIFVNNLGEDDGYQSYLLLNDGAGGFSDSLWQRSNGAAGIVQSGLFSNAFENYIGAYHPELIDYDNDGDFDIYMGRIWSWNAGPVFEGFGYAKNDGSANFTLVLSNDFLGPSTPAIHGTKTNSYEYTAHGDIDNDGDMDLLVYWHFTTEGQATYFQYFDNQGLAGFADVSSRIEGQETGGFLDPAVGDPQFQLVDLDADGDLDIVFARWTPTWGDKFIWFANDGAGNFSRIDEALFPGSQNFVIADVNGDWIPDMTYEVLRWKLPVGYDTNSDYAGIRYGEIKGAVRRTGWGTDDRIAGGDGNDKLFGLGGNDGLKGNGGNDKLKGGAGNDTLFGDAGRDKLFGGSGQDTLFGGSGNDKLKGQNGDDVIRGGAGADVLQGGKGMDILFGDKGRDKFVFKIRDGHDQIGDFEDNIDTLKIDHRLWGGGLTAQQVIDQFATVVNGDTVLDFHNGNTLTVVGLTNTALLVDDILLI